jgi:hypothetical protein
MGKIRIPIVGKCTVPYFIEVTYTVYNPNNSTTRTYKYLKVFPTPREPNVIYQNAFQRNGAFGRLWVNPATNKIDIEDTNGNVVLTYNSGMPSAALVASNPLLATQLLDYNFIRSDGLPDECEYTYVCEPTDTTVICLRELGGICCLANSKISNWCNQLTQMS